MTKKILIKCPECDNTAEGTITKLPGFPHYSYSGYCENCDYYILESEFEEVFI